MANNPKKITDPTEAALSAIQEALSTRDSAAEAEPASPPAPTPVEGHESHEHEHEHRDEVHAPPAEPVLEPVADAPWRTVHAAAVEKALFPDHGEEQAALRAPANDDRESIGQILRSLQRRPSRTSYVFATALPACGCSPGSCSVGCTCQSCRPRSDRPA